MQETKDAVPSISGDQADHLTITLSLTSRAQLNPTMPSVEDLDAPKGALEPALKRPKIFPEHGDGDYSVAAEGVAAAVPTAETTLVGRPERVEGLGGPCDQCGEVEPPRRSNSEPCWYSRGADKTVALCEECAKDWSRSKGTLPLPECDACGAQKKVGETWDSKFSRFGGFFHHEDAILCSRCYMKKDDDDDDSDNDSDDDDDDDDGIGLGSDSDDSDDSVPPEWRAMMDAGEMVSEELGPIQTGREWRIEQ